MQVTAVGLALLLLGLVLAIARPAWLYIATIFFLPFTATEIVNVGSGPSASGVQASMYFGSLLILTRILSVLWKMKLQLPRRGRVSLVWMGLFVAVTGLSLAMPLWIDGRLQIPSPFLGDFSSTPLYLKSGNITGVLYLVYGFLFTYIIAKTNEEPGKFRETLRSFFAGSIFAAVWGLVELACKVSGITYPTIFNNGQSLSAMGYMESLNGEGFRLSSVGVEPSVFAQTLLLAISLYLPFIFGRLRMFGKILDRVFFALLVMVLLLTTSSTAYVGVFFIVLLAFLLFGLRGILSPKYALIPIAGLGVMALLYISLPFARQVLDVALFTKSEGGSVAERLMTISNAYEVFLQYPVLGIGWASITSHDLIINILANAGVVGLFTFAAAMYSIFRSLYHSIKTRSTSLHLEGLMQMDFGLYVALGVTLATSALSGFLNTFSFFWFIVGLAIVGSNPDLTSLPRPQTPS